jgi:hypothetical protein
MNLDSVNRNLRSGGIRSLLVLGTAAAGNAVWMALRLNQPAASPSHWAWVGVSTLVGTVLIGQTWSALRNLGIRLTEEGIVVHGPGQPLSLRWSEVARLRCDSGRIILERTGAPPLAISLWHVREPDELHQVIRTLVPNRALRRTGS